MAVQRVRSDRAAQRGEHRDTSHEDRGTTADGDRTSDKSLDSQEFVKRAVEGNFAEIKASRLAQSKAQSPEVKQLAEQMITDHTKANSELAELAKTKNLTVPVDSGMMQNLSEGMLHAKSGESFDKAYLKDMEKDHKKTIELFQEAASSPKVDKDLQAYASKLLPKLQKHDHMVAQTESKLPSRSASSH